MPEICFLSIRATLCVSAAMSTTWVLEILPHLKSGVLVHIDDIHFPHLQSPDWWIFKNASFWQEEVLLKALLTHNNQIETIFCSSYLHAREPNRLQQALPLL